MGGRIGELNRLVEAAQAEIERIRVQTQVAADQEVKKARMELRREAAVLATGRDLSAQAPPAQRLPGLARPTVAKAATPLSILIIGGTGFTGPEAVEYALARGHKVTLLNRNRTRPDLFKGAVDQIIGDLNGDVSALKGASFDAVLDIPTTFPFWVRNVGQYLKGRVKHYTYISTLSVYSDDSAAWKDETDTTTPMPPNVAAPG